MAGTGTTLFSNVKIQLAFRSWMILLINLLTLLTVVTLSLFFYHQFRMTLDERVLLQLTSIKRLKRVQIEDYLNREWLKFEEHISTSNQEKNPSYIQTRLPDTLRIFSDGPIPDSTGIYDISSQSPKGHLLLAFVHKSQDQLFTILPHPSPEIQRILFERTGMGETGETYLVGADYRLRSVSRFFPEKPPFEIIARTKGVERALAGQSGYDIFEDYRSVPVYSAYHSLEIEGLNWIILSEIDVGEVTIPLQTVQRRLLFICLAVMATALLISLFLTEVVSRPILRMQKQLKIMAGGVFASRNREPSIVHEVNEMFLALEHLRTSLSQAIRFSQSIGQMDLEVKYQSSGENDTLGKSLLAMRDKLLEFNKWQEKSRLESKKLLIAGQENERRRLSRELHDGLGPLLTSLKLQVQALSLPEQEKARFKATVDETIQEIRKMSLNLMPHSVIDFGAAKALANLIQLVSQASPIDIALEDGLHQDESRVDADRSVALYRIGQELINNTLRHAEATKIRISLTEFDDKVCLYYLDDGRGFDIDAASDGAGLRNIRERVEVLEGYITFHSTSSGTQVEIEIPLGP